MLVVRELQNPKSAIEKGGLIHSAISLLQIATTLFSRQSFSLELSIDRGNPPQMLCKTIPSSDERAGKQNRSVS